MLKILDQILGSNDITMIESSLPTFEAFCEHHDANSLFGDKQYAGQYESLVRQYAQFASTRRAVSKGGPISRPMQMRWRNAGLSAIKFVSAADALSSLTGRQIDVIVPIILENLWTEDGSFISKLEERIRVDEKTDEEKAHRRRTSIVSALPADADDSEDPVKLPGTAADADMMAEEETGVLAMQCLKSIFVAPNRTQIYTATGALLKFVSERITQGEILVLDDEKGVAQSGWAIRMFNLVARWAPVQDRYVILLVALDTLMRTPVKDSTMEQQLVLSAMIGSLLRSDMNLVGLSIMDVLLGLIRQLRKLFQLQAEMSRSGSGGSTNEQPVKVDYDDSLRLHLRQRLERCIGDLANHVYYADQIWDMITAIMVRLKPSRKPSGNEGISTTPKEAATQQSGDDSLPDLADNQTAQLDNFFAYPAGRASALRIVKAIFLVANPQSKISGNVDLSRNRVPIQVWEGTHWLLRDTDGLVRKAYTDALITWLDRETTRTDALAEDESLEAASAAARNNREFSTSRRAVSGASIREKHHRIRRSHFLSLLHLAIYDNALQFVDYDSDMVLLHTLLAKLVDRLGVNAIRTGLPMVYRLQEEVQEVEEPIHKVRISALCHGYFWTVCEKFGLETSVGGRAIQNEIARRRNKGFWVHGINSLPPTLDEIATPGTPSAAPTWDVSELEREELLPFDDRTSLVQGVTNSYEEASRPADASPGLTPTGVPAHRYELPEATRQEMLSEWSRESLLATVAAQGRPESMAGSKSGTASKAVNRLTLNTNGANGNGSHLPESPYGSLLNLRPLSAAAAGADRFGTMSKLRKTSVQSGLSGNDSAPAKNSIASVDQLKMILAGNVSPKTVGIPGTAHSDDDSADSMVSFDYTHSEASFNPPPSGEPGSLPASTTGETLTQAIFGSKNGISHAGDEDEDGVPPVPPLPKLSSLAGKSGLLGDGSFKSKRSVGGQGSLRRKEESGKSMDLQDLLRGIDSTSGEGSLGNVSRPPY